MSDCSRPSLLVLLYQLRRYLQLLYHCVSFFCASYIGVGVDRQRSPRPSIYQNQDSRPCCIRKLRSLCYCYTTSTDVHSCPLSSSSSRHGSQLSFSSVTSTLKIQGPSTIGSRLVSVALTPSSSSGSFLDRLSSNSSTGSLASTLPTWGISVAVWVS